MWRNKLRLLIILGVSMLFIFLGLAFKSVPITDRAFVLGMGIDYTDNKYELTCEILVPAKYGGGGSANEESHKILSGEGVDIAHALNDIFKKTGKLPSLGHCSILILGEDIYGTPNSGNILTELEFFIKSDSFRASATVTAAEGKAKDLMFTKTPLEKFTSLSLFEIISVYGKNTDSPATTLGDFRSKLLSHSASSYLTLVKAIPAEGGAEGEDSDSTAGEAKGQPLVFYDCSGLAAFNSGGFAGFLSSGETAGLRHLETKNNYDTFRVKDKNENFTTVSLASKHMTASLSLGSAPQVIYEITVKIKPSEAEDLNTAEGFVISSEITDAMRETVKEQIESSITAAWNKSVSLNSDFLYLGKKFFAKCGRAWTDYTALNPNYLSKINLAVKVTVK